MSYFSTKKRVIDEICEEMETLNVTQLKDVLSVVKRKKPMTLREYIDKEVFSSFRDCEEIFRKTEIMNAFEHEVRSLCLDLGPNFQKVRTNSEYIIGFTEMCVDGQDLDIWIQETGCLFNPWELALVIYLLYTKELVFR